jgi:hypothetical protein
MNNKVGHPRNVETPEKMWDLYIEYFNWAKSNPRYKREYVGKDGNAVDIPLERPLTMEGFKGYCYDKVGTVEQYFKNQDGDYEEYLLICARIKEEIRRDQIEGGMVGQYNPSITQRLNGLTEKVETDNTHKGKIEITLDLNK